LVYHYQTNPSLIMNHSYASRKLPLISSSFFVLILLLGCQFLDPIVPQNDSIAGDLPLLRGTNRIGTIEGFNPSNPQATQDSMAARWQEAIDAGMTVGRLQIDWPELEPQPNVYDRSALEDRLQEYQSQGLQTFLLISAFDSEGPVVPEDLEGLAIDNPELIERFNALMDWVIPMLADYDGYIIAISNEADNEFNDKRGLHRRILRFLRAVKPHIHSINEEMAVTVTFAEGSLDNDVPGVAEIISACDVASWNFYGNRSFFEPPYSAVQSPEEIRADIQRMLEVSGTKNVVIQELGLHAGDETLSSSEELQRRFFEVFFSEMEQEERIKVAYNFQLVDWSPEVTDIYLQLLDGEELPELFVQQLVESLNTIGLIHYQDGRRKPAWDEFVRWWEIFR
jgi:hypothetical protein